MPTRRERVRAFFRKHFVPVEPVAHAPSPGSSTRASPSQTRSNSRPATPRSHHPPSGVTVADRPITQPRERRRRRRRRTASPVGLPLYSQEPQEQEMTLSKSVDPAASQVDLSLSRATTGEGSFVGDSELDGEGEGDEGGLVDDDEEDEHSFFARPSIDVSGDGASGQRRPGSMLLSAPLVVGRPRSASEPLGAGAGRRGRSGSSASGAVRPGMSPYLSHTPGGSSPFASRSGLIDLPVRPSSPPSSYLLSSSVPGTSTPPSSRPSYFSHRSSRSSPINALAPPSPPPTLGRPRASTLQRLMGSSANSSSSSLVLPPGPGVAGAGAGRSPYGSLGSRASSSTMSIRDQGISSPLPNSFVHSSFVYPKGGPTPQQVAFLSSRESLGAYGYGPGVALPPPSSAAHRDAAGDVDQPPAFEPGVPTGLAAPVAASSGQGGVRGRARSGSAASATSMGSPLARVVTLPQDGGEADVDARERVDTAATAVPERERVTAPVEAAPPLPALELSAEDDVPRLPALELDFGSLALSIPSPSPSSPSPSPLPATATSSSSPPSIRATRPPDIVTCAPTPTTSAAPSPRLPAGAGSAGFAYAPPSPPPPPMFGARVAAQLEASASETRRAAWESRAGEVEVDDEDEVKAGRAL
ncbi:uncharacterized protein RHOBADRAFT_51533 [Rhodotorula graminis WP1]|uniref:Proteophosphoglycan ppg4 n=1 Tax=Rhodotorula graminis (strain WP1) TaxID=578459 RepID=A0A194SB82_RHOGW|nr:uncharacterized protein RHOBADRAFT_51533 [Rhodotorula graminis WP1]KPV77715.1 hypothetical protein RHOBADRAFT_51533 [Rhodotorula graminis WP1]